MFKATKTNTSKSNSRNIAQHLTNRYSYSRIRVTEGQERKVMKSEETIQGPRGLVPGVMKAIYYYVYQGTMNCAGVSDSTNYAKISLTSQSKLG